MIKVLYISSMSYVKSDKRDTSQAGIGLFLIAGFCIFFGQPTGTESTLSFLTKRKEYN